MLRTLSLVISLLIVSACSALLAPRARCDMEWAVCVRPGNQGGPAIHGSRLVWYEGPIGAADLYMKDLYTGRETTICTASGDQTEPDIWGDRIVWRDSRSGGADIYMYDLAAAAEAPICTAAGDQQSPAIWGDRIVWTDHRSGGADIYMYDLATATETAICPASGDQTEPDMWGDRIVWRDTRSGGADIYMYDLATATETPICTAAGDQQSPAIWGDRIVWTDHRSGGADIYMYDLVAAAESPIATAPEFEFMPAIWDDRVVWWDYAGEFEDSDIYMYDLTIGARIAICTDSADQTACAIFGDRIVWVDDRNGNPDIYMYEFETWSGTMPVAAHAWDELFPDVYGHRVAWQDMRSGNWDIYVWDSATSTETPVCVDPATQWLPAIWGDRIVWEDARNFNGDIYLYDVVTATETPICTETSWQLAPAIWGDRIVYTDLRNAPGDMTSSDIYMYDLLTATETPICTSAGQQAAPAIWGDRIVWTDNRSGDYDIYMYDLSTATETAICTAPGAQTQPSIWGERVAWMDERSGNYDIYMYDLATDTETAVCTAPGTQGQPDIWGDRIVWEDFRSGDGDIYMRDVATGTERPVRAIAGHQQSPAIWGERVVWRDYCKGLTADADVYIYKMTMWPFTGLLRGQVRVRGTTTNIEGATVSAYLNGSLEASAVTDAYGLYTIAGLYGSPDTYEVAAGKQGWVTQTKAGIKVWGDGTVTYVNFGLELSETMTGQVTDRDTGANVEGATVCAYLNDRARGSGVTNAAGIYVIDSDLPAGTYSVAASKPGYETQTKAPVTVTAGETSYVNFSIKRVALKGQVRHDVTGAPLVGAVVKAYPGSKVRADLPDDTVVETVTQAPYGIYEFGHELPPGGYIVVASYPGCVRQSKRDIVVGDDVIAYCNFSLGASGTLTGQVKGIAGGTPLPFATIDVFKDGSVWVSGTSRGDYGIYAINSDLAGGSYLVRASRPGYVRQYKYDVSIAPAATTYLNFNLQLSSRLKGQVKDKTSGAPIIGATVVARSAGIVWATATTTAPYGIYEMDRDLPPGTYLVGASKTGYLGQTRKDISLVAGHTTYVNFFLQPAP
ncbi:MAG: carboxypeptidase regulatory-like domain-containing protein [Armatimonadota bacterium]|nr:MAG: carboxypeptidase regulatory-like domain-containing protein [Armatimonadota bacterium]